MKICTRCRISKELSEFNIRTSSHDGHTAACKACRAIESKQRRDNLDKVVVAEYDKKYRIENRGKLKEYYKKYDMAHPDTEFRRKQKAEYQEKNKEQIGEYSKKWRMDNRDLMNRQKRERRKNPLIRLKCNLRTLIGNRIRESGYTKKSKCFSIIGCTIDDLRLHLESKFQSGMSWQNYGQWHVDHKQPLAFAKTERELIGLFHYTNLQPLWAIDNIKKGAKQLISAV
jgi:hypothetical protein